MVGLVEGDVHRWGERGAVTCEGGFDVGERRAAVDTRFAVAEEVEVWAVENEDMFRHFEMS